MDIETYSVEAMKTAATYKDSTDQLVCAALGLCGEGAELIHFYRSYFNGAWTSTAVQDLTAKEIGDCAWYINLACCALDVPMAKVAINGECLVTLPMERLQIVAGLLADKVKKHVYQGHALHLGHVIFDLQEYWGCLHLLASSVEWAMPDVLQTNIDKLQRKRFKDGFSVEASVARVDVAHE